MTQRDIEMTDEYDIDEPEGAEEQVSPEAFVAAVTQSINIADQLSEDDRTRFGNAAIQDYELDRESMSEWLGLMERGIALATLIKVTKTYPHAHASNVKYPLITSAALQFNARAYPAIVPADRIVSVKTYGTDQDGQKANRADRVAAHMSYQLSSEIEEWEEDTDKLLLQLPVVGTLVRKVWWDAARERPRCRTIDAGKFIINNRVKILADAPRATEEISLYPDEIRERVKSGVFRDVELPDPDGNDKSAPHEFIEQHCRLDLDEDGYGEPYILTVHKETKKVVRLVADFDNGDVVYLREQQEAMVQVIGQDEFGQPFMTEQPQMQEVVTGIKAIRRGSYFVPFHFMPSLDGGFFGTGLGLLLGDISETINTIINMMLDAGHMASLGGGFIGSEMRIKGGSNRFTPGEWKMTSAAGGDVRSALVPLTFPGPDAVLFQMLGMLIDAGREIASVSDVMTGDTGGKVQTATTTIALIEQGMMVFTAAYKRIFRSLKQEFKLLAKLNVAGVSAEQYNRFHDQEQQFDPAEDYAAGDMDIVPVADPRSVTKMQEAAKAQLLMQLSDMGVVDKGEAAQRVLASADITDRDKLAAKPNPMDEFASQMQMELGKATLTQKMADIELTLAQVEKAKSDAVKNMAEADATVARARLDMVSKALEVARDDIQRTIAIGLGRMASQPGYGGAAQGNPFATGNPQGGNPGGILGGPPGFG